MTIQIIKVYINLYQQQEILETQQLIYFNHKINKSLNFKDRIHLNL
jgi:hypothetical protein